MKRALLFIAVFSVVACKKAPAPAAAATTTDTPAPPAPAASAAPADDTPATGSTADPRDPTSPDDEHKSAAKDISKASAKTALDALEKELAAEK